MMPLDINIKGPNEAGRRLLVGGWNLLGPATAEAMALSDLDWIGLDAQHGLYDDRMIIETLHLLQGRRNDIIVRIPANDGGKIGRVLDAGARGVIVPMVETAADAEAAAGACRYPPKGSRSWGQMVGNWGRPEVDPATSNANVLCAVMVESDEGLANVEAIAATEGVDMIYVGPFDLSIALGTSVDAVLEAGRDGPLGKILVACERHGVVPGAFAGTEARTRQLAEIGFTFLAVGTDAGLLKEASNSVKAKFGDDPTGTYGAKTTY